MIPWLAITTFFSKVPKWVWAIVIGLVLFGILTESVLFYGDQREKYGRQIERAVWTEKYHQAQLQIAAAQTDLARVRGERDQAIAERDRARNAAVTHVQTEIVNAPDAQAALAAYTRFADSMRNAALARRTRAWADYNASVAAAPSNRTGMHLTGNVEYASETYSGCGAQQLLPMGSSVGPV